MEPDETEQFLWDLLRGMTHLHMKAKYYVDGDAHNSLHSINNELLERHKQTPPRRPTRRNELRRK